MNIREFNTYLGSVADTELAIRKEAAKVHENVNQIYGNNHPYFYHLNQVATIVISYLPEIITKKEDILPVLLEHIFMIQLKMQDLLIMM